MLSSLISSAALPLLLAATTAGALVFGVNQCRDKNYERDQKAKLGVRCDSLEVANLSLLKQRFDAITLADSLQRNHDKVVDVAKAAVDALPANELREFNTAMLRELRLLPGVPQDGDPR